MPTQPTDPLDFGRLANASTVLKGRIAMTQCDRLGALTRPGSADIVYEIRFGRSAGLPSVDGQVGCELRLTCNRCLRPLLLPLDLRVSLAVIEDESGLDGVPDDREPWIAPGGMGRIQELVEEEILLAVPDYPAHVDLKECMPQTATGETSGRTSPTRPFADLRQMISKSEDTE